MRDPLYRLEGGRYMPSAITAGPWDPRAQHGGPPSALLARAVEQHSATGCAPDAMTLGRVTVELLRPVPFIPLTIDVRTLRPGRKIQLVEAVLRADDTEVARAVGLRVRRASADIPASAIAAIATADAITPPFPGPEAGTPAPRMAGLTTGFYAEGCELRVVRGGVDLPGPAVMWGRLLHPLVNDEPFSPVQRAVAMGDFSNAVGSILVMGEWSFINADLTVHLFREPQGEWIAVDSLMRIGPHGVGIAAARLCDQIGPVGNATQTLLVEPVGNN